jgi:hypothetical protein
MVSGTGSRGSLSVEKPRLVRYNGYLGTTVARKGFRWSVDRLPLLVSETEIALHEVS